MHSCYPMCFKRREDSFWFSDTGEVFGVGHAKLTARGCTESTSILSPGIREPQFLLDGVPFLGNLEELEDATRVADVLAIETYPTDISVHSSLWRRSNTCALVAVWTHRP